MQTQPSAFRQGFTAALGVLAALILLAAAPTAAAMTFETKGEQIAIGGEVPEGWKEKVVLVVTPSASCPSSLWNKDGLYGGGQLSEARGGDEDISGESIGYTEGNSFWTALEVKPTTGAHAACLYQAEGFDEIGVEECSGEGLYKECYYRYPLVSELGTFTYVNAEQQKREGEQAHEAEERAKAEGEQRQAKEKDEAEERAEALAEARASRESIESTERYLRGVAKKRRCSDLPYAPDKTCEAYEKAIEAEGEIREQAAIRAKEDSPLKRLRVKVRAHWEGNHRAAGFTRLAVTAAPYASVTIKISRYGHRIEHYQLEEGALINDKVPWSCQRPGGVFRYTVSAHTDAGKTLIHRGEFRPLDTVALCAEVQHNEEQHDRAEREGQKRDEETARREAEQHRREWEANCRAENGTPRTLNTSEGPERYCVAPDGGFLSVPEP